MGGVLASPADRSLSDSSVSGTRSLPITPRRSRILAFLAAELLVMSLEATTHGPEYQALDNRVVRIQSRGAPNHLCSTQSLHTPDPVTCLGTERLVCTHPTL